MSGHRAVAYLTSQKLEVCFLWEEFNSFTLFTQLLPWTLLKNSPTKKQQLTNLLQAQLTHQPFFPPSLFSWDTTVNTESIHPDLAGQGTRKSREIRQGAEEGTAHCPQGNQALLGSYSLCWATLRSRQHLASQDRTKVQLSSHEGLPGTLNSWLG